jgi:hypothetical protein
MNDKTVELNAAKIKKERQIVMGKPVEKNGLTTDYAPCYFVMNDNVFNKDLDKLLLTQCTSNQIIEVFWYHFQPYLKAQVDDNYKMAQKVSRLAEDGQDTVNMFGEMKFKHDLMEDFIKAKGLNKEFEELFRREKNILEAKTKKLLEENAEANNKAGTQLSLL